MALYERSGVLWAVCDDLVDGVQNRHHCFPVKILRWVLLPTRQITDKVSQSVVPCVTETTYHSSYADAEPVCT